MKLLFDENLSDRLVGLLAGLFPGSCHVKHVGLMEADDEAVWTFARANGFTLVTKDRDFQQLSALLGAPPKVLWLRLGNCSTERLAECLQAAALGIAEFDQAVGKSILILTASPSS